MLCDYLKVLIELKLITIQIVSYYSIICYLLFEIFEYLFKCNIRNGLCLSKKIGCLQCQTKIEIVVIVKL